MTRPSTRPAVDGAAAGAAPPRLHRRPAARLRDHGIVVVLATLVVALSLFADAFLTPGNLVNLLDQAVVGGLLVCGTSLCLTAGVFDLSMGAVLALSAITATAVTAHSSPLTGALVGVAVGALAGLGNGLVVTGIGLHSFITTLALGVVYRGIGLIVTAGVIITPLPKQLTDFQLLAGPTAAGGTTAASWLLVAVAAVYWLLLSRTVLGRHIHAVGGNAEAARVCGVDVARVRVTVLVLSGVCSALAGLVLASRGGSAQADMGTGAELTAIAAAVVGGISVLGGHGAVWRGLVGVALLTLIGNGFNLLGWDTSYQRAVEGLLILGAAGVDHVLRKQAGPRGPLRQSAEGIRASH